MVLSVWETNSVAGASEVNLAAHGRRRLGRLPRAQTGARCDEHWPAKLRELTAVRPRTFFLTNSKEKSAKVNEIRALSQSEP